MGAIESTEVGNFWESSVEIARGTESVAESNREDEIYGGEETARHEEETPGETRHEGEITSEADKQEPAVPTTNQELERSRSQKTNQVAPANGEVAKAEIRVSRAAFYYRDVPFSLLFVGHLTLVTAGIIFLDVMYLKDMSTRKLHNLERWFPKLGAAVAVGSLFACGWQILFKYFPAFMAKAVLWTSSLLTLVAAIMLISTSLPINLGLGILWFIFAICLGLYSCWVSSRIEYAAELLCSSLKTASNVRGYYFVSLWVLLLASLWLVFWSFGVVTALSYNYPALIIFALLVSLAWTLEVLRNIVHTTVARAVARTYLEVNSGPGNSWKSSLHTAYTSCFGSICLGSLMVPCLHALRVVARGLTKIQGENEILFSCTDCFLSVMGTLIRYANNWAFVQVGVHNKAFVKASKDTWDLFEAKKLDILINTDLTSSFCVLSGIAGGNLCVLVCGGWTFATRKALTISISVVTFFIGYFLVRIAMAVPQGSVCAHYVCYAENPASQSFKGSPVQERLKELLGDVDPEAAKEV